MKQRMISFWKYEMSLDGQFTFSEKVLYGLSIGWVFAFSSSTSPYDQLFWICNVGDDH